MKYEKGMTNFTLKDELLYSYDVLYTGVDLIDGTLALTIKTGLANLIYPGVDLSQVNTYNFKLLIELYK